MTENPDTQITPDAMRGTLAERVLPGFALPYARLARADRPIGWWLLLWPCWWSAAMAAGANGDSFPSFWHLFLFFVGAVVMRGAGCTYNDIVDRQIDAQVERTRARPIPSGAVSVRNAKIYMIALSLTGFLVLIQFNLFSILLGIVSLAVVAVYPFMKRITSWPQFVLGLAFSWGALMGWAAVFGNISLAPILLYIGCVFWTIGYDTVYAHQDAEDDAIVGVKSTALLFGKSSPYWVAGFYVLAWTFMISAGLTAGAGTWFVTGMLIAAAHLAWQVYVMNPDDGMSCLEVFRSNRDYGWIVFMAFTSDALVSAAV